MSRKKSIAMLIVVAVLILFLAFVTFVPLNNGELGVKNFNSVLGNLNLGTELDGGMYANYSAELKEGVEEDYDKCLDDATTLFESVIGAYGFSSLNIADKTHQDGVRGFRVEVNATTDFAQYLNAFGTSGKLEFCGPSTQDNDGKSVKGTVLFDGTYVESSYAVISGGSYYVVIVFTEEGTTKFSEATANNKSIGIWMDDSLIVEPGISEQITSGTVQIGGNYTREQALLLASRIQISSLEVTVKLEDFGVISPVWGVNTKTMILIAAAICILVVLAALIVLYRNLGIAAAVSLFAFALLFVLFVAMFEITVTLMGVVSFIFCFALAAAFNIIIIERIRFEYSISPAEALPSAFKAGFTKSLWSVLDVGITVVLAGAAMYILGALQIKSFAGIVLTGTVLAVVMALLFTRVLLYSFIPLNSTNAKSYGLSKNADVVGGDK